MTGFGSGQAVVGGSHPAADRAPRVSDRTAFTAIVFVLVTGVPWRMVPRQIGCSGVTAWRRLREWQRAGVWERLHRELLRRLNAQGYIHVLSSYSGHSSLGPV